MGLGIQKKIVRLNVKKDCLIFELRKVLLGFENANCSLSRLDKHSMIPILRKNGATIDKNCDIESGIVFHNCRDYKNFVVGKNCHIGKRCFFDLQDKIVIHNNVVISMNTTFITHIDLSKSELGQIYKAEKNSIEIYDNVFIGANATLLMGTTIEKNSIIAAGSLVRSRIKSYILAAGVPTKIIKRID